MIHPSRHVTQGMDSALNRIYFHAMGLTRENIDGPLVGVATAWDGGAPAGELPLRVASAAEEGVWAGGATPRQFATVAEGGRADARLAAGLLTREVVADSVELTMRGHSYDALVGIAASPLALAGLLLAIARLDVPGLVVPIVGDALGSDPDAIALGHAAEAVGLALPGATEAGATIEGALMAATEAGRALQDRAAPRTLVTAETLLDAAREIDPRLAIHLAALANECGLPLGLRDLVGDAWIRGSLAPDGALLTGPLTEFSGPATFTEWTPGSVLVVRGRGPKGGPALPVLDLDLPEGAIVVTDGRVPDLSGVTCVSCVGPEDGPIASLAEGDLITLSGSELHAVPSGQASWYTDEPLPPALAKYRATVRPATTGAATHPGGAGETIRYADL